MQSHEEEQNSLWFNGVGWEKKGFAVIHGLFMEKNWKWETSKP